MADISFINSGLFLYGCCSQLLSVYSLTSSLVTFQMKKSDENHFRNQLHEMKPNKAIFFLLLSTLPFWHICFGGFPTDVLLVALYPATHTQAMGSVSLSG